MVFCDLSIIANKHLVNVPDVISAVNNRISDDIPGEYSILGSDIYVKILHYNTKNIDFITESHKQYVDLQMVYDGIEIVRIYDEVALTVKEEYNPKTDCQFYTIDQADSIATLKLSPGKVALFFPDDVHETQISHLLIPTSIKKAVVKIHVKFFA
jgi:biofilm protein TabA